MTSSTLSYLGPGTDVFNLFILKVLKLLEGTDPKPNII